MDIIRGVVCQSGVVFVTYEDCCTLALDPSATYFLLREPRKTLSIDQVNMHQVLHCPHRLRDRVRKAIHFRNTFFEHPIYTDYIYDRDRPHSGLLNLVSLPLCLPWEWDDFVISLAMFDRAGGVTDGDDV